MATTTTRIDFDEGAAPATPAANDVRLYAKADGLLYSKDDAGVETLVSGGSGGGGAVATDAIWDAAGDLAQGTGANTAAKLGAGAWGTVLRAGGAATAVAWALPVKSAYLSGDSASSSTSFADVTGMGFAVEASHVYHFRYVVFFNTNATSVGIRLAVNGPASPTLLKLGGFISTGAGGQNDSTIAQGSTTAYDTPVIITTTGPGGTNAFAIIEGLFSNGVNAGTLILRHASETATATTIEAGSFGTLVEVA